MDMDMMFQPLLGGRPLGCSRCQSSAPTR